MTHALTIRSLIRRKRRRETFSVKIPPSLQQFDAFVKHQLTCLMLLYRNSVLTIPTNSHLAQNIIVFVCLFVFPLLRVCRRWRRIVLDKSLWHHVDLLPYQLDLRKMWKLVRAHLSDRLQTLRIRGLWDTSQSRCVKHYH